MSDTEAKLCATIKDMPDGSVRVIFTQAPNGAYVGMVTAEGANTDVLALIAGQFAVIANQRRSGLQVAGAGAIGQLDAATRRNGTYA